MKILGVVAGVIAGCCIASLITYGILYLWLA